MPSWGRSSRERNGGNNNRRRKEWERQEWENSRRFEELSDSDGMEYTQDYEVSELSSEGDYDEDDMQLAMRDKEEVLVNRAMARIRRAQELGREHVKLTPAESEALERKMAKDRAKGRKPFIKQIAPPQRKSSRQSLSNQAGPVSKRKGSRSSLSSQQEEYSDRPRSRTASGQSLRQAPPQPTRRRAAIPEDPNYRPRSSSSAQNTPPYPIPDQYGFIHPPPALPPALQVGYTRSPPTRHVSGPAELQYTQHLPYPSTRGYASSSDPSFARRISASGATGANRRQVVDISSDDDDSAEEDSDAGVQVDVVPTSSNGAGYEVVRTTSGGSGRAQQVATGTARRRGGFRR